MSQPSYQTVKLARGRHVSPEAGVCVMELSSMLAGEPFSDRPRSVSPVIAGFLRAYNDLIDDRRRQDLYRCAAEVLGTAGPREVELARAARLQDLGEQLRAERWWRRVLPRRMADSKRRPQLRPHQAGPYAVHSIFRLTDAVHLAVLTVVDELVAMGQRPGLLEAEPGAAGAARSGGRAAGAHGGGVR
jgi:hypothetical protein